MKSKRLVEMVYEELEPPRIPIHFETTEKLQEAMLGDVLLGHAWVPKWRGFFDNGGPFRRSNEELAAWIKELDIEGGYDWPSVEEEVQETIQEFKKSIEDLRKLSRFVVLEVIGPTEQSEYFLCPKNRQAV